MWVGEKPHALWIDRYISESTVIETVSFLDRDWLLNGSKSLSVIRRRCWWRRGAQQGRWLNSGRLGGLVVPVRPGCTRSKAASVCPAPRVKIQTSCNQLAYSTSRFSCCFYVPACESWNHEPSYRISLFFGILTVVVVKFWSATGADGFQLLTGANRRSKAACSFDSKVARWDASWGACCRLKMAAMEIRWTYPFFFFCFSLLLG